MDKIERKKFLNRGSEMKMLSKTASDGSGKTNKFRSVSPVLPLAIIMLAATLPLWLGIPFVHAAVYSPGKLPKFGEDYKGPKGADYDAMEDPNHPLRDPTKDPGEGWEGNHGRGTNYTSVKSAKGEWPWGERYFDGKFGAPLEIENECTEPQPVGIFIKDLPYLTMPKLITVPNGKTNVMGKVQLPPEPDPPINLGLPGSPGWGHVDFGPIIVPPGGLPFKLHQPHFGKIEGTVVVWHPWDPTVGVGVGCVAVRKTYTVTGHIHFRPPPPKGSGGGPEEIAKTDECQFYWLIGKPPVHLGDKDCTGEMRELAVNFRERILTPYVLNAPEEWEWLPSSSAILQMVIPDLLAMKAHAEAVTGVGPGAIAAASGKSSVQESTKKERALSEGVRKVGFPGKGTPTTGATETPPPRIPHEISVAPLETEGMIRKGVIGGGEIPFDPPPATGGTGSVPQTPEGIPGAISVAPLEPEERIRKESTGGNKSDQNPSPSMSAPGLENASNTPNTSGAPGISVAPLSDNQSLERTPTGGKN